MQIHSQDSLLRVHGLAPAAPTRNMPGQRSHLYFVWGFLRAIVRREVAYLRGARHYNDLATLPDHLLRDIGVTPDSVQLERRKHSRGLLRDHWI